MTEEIVTTPEVKVEEAPQSTQTPDISKVIENYESLLKQQQSQFEQLMKQQELTTKVNQQLVSQLNNVSKQQASSTPSDEHWIDKVLREEFQFESKIDPRKNPSDFVNKNTKQVALWWLQYQKDKGRTNEEIANQYYRMMSGVEAELSRNDY